MALFGIEVKHPLTKMKHSLLWPWLSFFFFDHLFSIAVLSGCCRMQCGRSYLTFFSPLPSGHFPYYFKKIHLLLLLWLEHIFVRSIQLLNGYSEHSHQIHGTMSVRLWVDQQTLVSYTKCSGLCTSKLDHRLFGASTLSVLLYALLNSIHTYHTQ